MVALRVHVRTQRKRQLDDLRTSRQEGKHQPALIHNSRLTILNARSTAAGYTDLGYASLSGRRSALIKSKVMKGILLRSAVAFWRQLVVKPPASCVTSPGWRVDEKNVGLLSLLPADPPPRSNRKGVGPRRDDTQPEPHSSRLITRCLV